MISYRYFLGKEPLPSTQGADVEDPLFALQATPLLGQDPPAFRLESLDGKKVSLDEYRGKPVFLYFWASW